MNKRKLSLLLVLSLLLQICSVGLAMAASPSDSLIKNTLEGFRGTVIERKVIDQSNGVFAINAYAYNFAGNTMHVYLEWDPAKVSLYSMGQNMAFTADSMKGQIVKQRCMEGYTHYMNDMFNPADVSLTGEGGYLLFANTTAITAKEAVSFTEGWIKAEIGRNLSADLSVFDKVDLDGYWSAVDKNTLPGEAFVGHEDYSLGYGIVTMYFKVNDGYSLNDVTPEVVHPYANAADETNPNGVRIKNAETGEASTDIYYTGFPSPAAAPTNVTVSADPSQIVSGGTATITAGADAPADGGTLSYALYSNASDSTSGGTLVTDFQAGTTFSVTPSTDTYYYVVAKNTKTEGGEETTATATSASTAKVSVLQSISAVTVPIEAPVTGNTPQASIAATEQYTGSIAWTPADNPFKGTADYTATVTLAAKEGYLFDNAALTAITVNGSTAVRNAAFAENNRKLTFDASFPTTGKSAAQLVAEAKTAVQSAAAGTFNVDEIVTNPGTAEAADNTTPAEIKRLLETKLGTIVTNGVTVTVGTPNITKAAVPGRPGGNVNGEDGTYSAVITLSSGAASDTVTVNGTIVAQAASKKAQNQAAVNTAVTAIEAAAYPAVNMADKNTAALLKAEVERILAGLGLSEGVTTTVTGSLTAAIGGTYADPAGTPGTYTFTVEASKGTVTPEGEDMNTDYKMTKTSRELTVSITPTPFTAQVTGEGSVKTTAGFEQLLVNWTAPKTNGVPVSGYKLTVKDASGNVVTGYDKKDMGTATSATVKNLTNGTAYTIEVEVSFASLLDPVTLTGTGSPVAGDPKPITLHPAKTEDGSVTGPAVGTVKLALADGTEIDPSEVRENFDVKLYAVPKPGYRFVKWERVKGIDPAPETPLLSETYSFEDTNGEYTQNPLTIKVTETSEFTPVFAETASIATTAPALQQLLVNLPEGRRLIQENTEAEDYDAFHSLVPNYTLYLTKNEDRIELQPFFNSSKYDVTISGQAIATTAAVGAVDDVDRTGTTFGAIVADGTVIPIVVTDQKDAAKTTTYNITIRIVEKNPQMLLELDAAVGTKISMLNVKAANAAFLSGVFTIDLNNDVTVDTATISGFEGFGRESGMVLADGEYATAADICKNLSPTVKIESLKVSNGGKTLQVTFASADGTPVITTDDQAILFKLFLVKTDASNTNNDTDAQLLQTMEINKAAGNNAMSEKFFSDTMNYVEEVNGAAATLVEEQDRLVVLKLADKYVIVGYVTARPNNERVYFNVVDVLNGANEQLNDAKLFLEEHGKLLYRAGQGEYMLEIRSPGFLAQTTNKLTVATEGVDLNAMTLIAGDVNDDGVIDAADRTALVNALGGTVVAGDLTDIGGYVLGDGGAVKTYADLNDDGVVNALDLGKVLRGITIMKTK